MLHVLGKDWKKVAHKGDTATQKEEGAEAELSVYRPPVRQLGLMLAAGPGALGLT